MLCGSAGLGDPFTCGHLAAAPGRLEEPTPGQPFAIGRDANAGPDHEVGVTPPHGHAQRVLANLA